MAGGILSLLREIFSDKMADLDRNYYARSEELEKQLAKKNPAFREITEKIKAKEKLKLDLNDEIDELERVRNKLVPKKLDAKDKAEEKLRKEYLELRVKATLEGIPKEKVKKLVEDFQSKDFLAEAMGV
jgi:chromosome segregation ATPase